MSDEATADETVGTRLKALREDAGLSQRALARRASVNPETIRRLEADQVRPHLGTLRKLAAALGVPPEVLTGGCLVPGPAPTAKDLRAGLRAALVDRGVLLGPAGDDAAALAAAIAARGWHVTVEDLAPSTGGRQRYQAMVFRFAAGSSPLHVSGRGRGATAVAALAKALARLLERTG